jgi:hypothetical protein
MLNAPIRGRGLRLITTLLLCLGIPFYSGCFETNPDDVVKEFIQHVKKGEIKAAHKLLSSNEQDKVKEYNEIVLKLKEQHPDLAAKLELKPPIQVMVEEWQDSLLQPSRGVIIENSASVVMADKNGKEKDSVPLIYEGTGWHISTEIYKKEVDLLKDYIQVWVIAETFVSYLHEGLIDKAWKCFVPSDRDLINRFNELLRKYPDPPEDAEALRAWESIRIEEHFLKDYKGANITIGKPSIQEEFAYITLISTKGGEVNTASFQLVRNKERGWLFAFGFPPNLDKSVEVVIKQKSTPSEFEEVP